MGSQLDLFEYANSVRSLTYSEFRKCLEDILSHRPDSLSNTQFQENKRDLAVSFFSPNGSSRSLWIVPGTKKHKLEIKYSYYMLIDSLIEKRDSVKRLSNGRVALPFADLNELNTYTPIILDIYDYCEREAKGRLFDCCNRYLECSDAKECTHPDRDFSLCCSYRRMLKQGVIFYGKNRTTD